MFERLRFQGNYARFIILLKSFEARNDKTLKKVKKDFDYLIHSARRILELGEAIGNVEGYQEITNIIKDQMPRLEAIAADLEQAGTYPYQEQNPLRLEVKKQFLELSSQAPVTEGNTNDFVAARMVDMYSIAAERLDSDISLLKMIYVENESAPLPIQEVITQYINDKITQDAAKAKLAELQEKTKQYLQDLGTNPDNAQHPRTVFTSPTPDLERRLSNEIVAESMRDDGSINPAALFELTAEVALINNLAKLAKALNRPPKPEELVKAHIDAYRQTHEFNPEMGDFEGDFESWIQQRETQLMATKGKYSKASLPIYNEIAQKVKDQ